MGDLLGRTRKGRAEFPYALQMIFAVCHRLFQFVG
jgi:hypothetical protein